MSKSDYPDYQVFKGLQKPLEFLGFQGRYIFWAAGTAAGSLLGFMITYSFIGFMSAIGCTTAILSFGVIMIVLKQRKGLHSKKEEKGVYIYVHDKYL